MLAMDVVNLTVERRELEESPVEEQAFWTISVDRLSSIWRQRHDKLERALGRAHTFTYHNIGH